VYMMPAAHAQRPVNDTLWGTDSTYMYYLYDWWRTANHEPEAPHWQTCRADEILRGFALPPSPYRDELDPYYSGPLYYPDHPGEVRDYGWLNYCPGNNVRGVQMYTDHPIKVVGIAACAYAQEPQDTTLYWVYNCGGQIGHPERMFPNTRDTTLAGRLTDSLQLYDVGSGTLHYLAGGPWRVEYPHRNIPLPPLYSISPYELLDSSPIVPLYEVMLDKPQVVADSFVVAGTSYNNEGSYAVQYCPGFETRPENMWLWNHPPTRYWTLFLTDMDHYMYSPNGWPDIDDFPLEENVVWFKYRSARWMRSVPRDSIHPQTAYNYIIPTVNAIFPIIEPDFDTVLCDVVSNVHLVDKTDSSLTLMWNGGNNVEWEVEYAEEGEATTHTVTVTVPMATLTGLRPNTKYLAHVRGRCDAGVEYGEWSEIIEVRTEQYHPQEEKIDDLDRFTQMMPNPAHEEVTVISSYRLSRVVVYDLQGHSVIEQEGEGLATAFDVGRLAKGVYVVAIHTPAGIATKRLVVE
ncbi:MAG: T9SS type A sorting domain-containing protein, partial [Bacteroidales bacterium]|nr:T9SS type A sorting domain-containing protein [Bacteroidales bacterium]